MRLQLLPAFSTTLGLILCAASALPAQDSSLQDVIDRGALRVAAEPETPPMLFREGKSYDGFDYAIAKKIAERLGVHDVVIISGKYSDLPAKVIAGQADVIISGYTADDSIVGVSWSDSYYDYGLCLVARKDSKIKSTRDLAGRVVGIFNDPAAEEEVESMNIGYSRLNKYEDGYFDLLDQKQIDGFVYDYPYAQEEIKPFDGRLEIVEFNLSKSTYNVGVRAGSDSLLRGVNSAIRSIKASNDYRNFIKKYLGGTGAPPPLPPPLPNSRPGDTKKTSPDPTAPTGQQRLYTVKPGDYLSKIAREQLGSSSRWPEIFEVNSSRIADPNLIDVGWVLILPSK